MKVKITGLLLIFSVVVGMAQQKKWTLEECVYYAVENNLTVAQYELDLENAKIDQSDALGALLPNLNGTLQASANTGLALDPTTNNLVSATIFSAQGDLTSSVTLFDGLRNYNRIERAKLSGIANQYRLDDIKDDIRLSVANAYLQVLSNKESLKVFKAQLAVTEQDLKRTNELVESGVVARGDLLELEATAAGQEQQIINSQSLILISRINLAQMLGITDYENFDIAEEEFDIPPSDILDNSAKVIFDKALTFRNDIKFALSGVELAEKDLEISKGAKYPSIGAFINYNTRYSDQNNDPFTGEKIPLKDQLYINDGISYGAQMSIPIFNGWSVRNSIKRSQISVDIARIEYERTMLQLETDVNQAYVDVTSFYKAYEAAQKTLEARSLAYQYSKERFDVGLMNSFDFSQAQSRVDNAEAELIRTKYDYIFRLKILEFYFGIPISLE
ncbi:TolC family protein [Maribacter aquivivus]|jgi:outer membrane protein|uniref:Outer membrane protein n=1 Tax=Maribacter aquivivus TaxID=228958 RepID=A0A1M6M094_9FLAO|nr:TolC family protein [Maribacter aquivivus]SHJ76929.1 outer membrane protein [Maribacter aquivivus]